MTAAVFTIAQCVALVLAVVFMAIGSDADDTAILLAAFFWGTSAVLTKLEGE